MVRLGLLLRPGSGRGRACEALYEGAGDLRRLTLASDIGHPRDLQPRDGADEAARRHPLRDDSPIEALKAVNIPPYRRNHCIIR